MGRTRKLAMVVLLGSSVAMFAGCSSGNSGGAGTPDDDITLARTARSDSAAERPRDAHFGGVDTTVAPTTTRPTATLEGVWTATIQDLMTGGAAAGEGAMQCAGNQTLTFRNGRVTIAGHGECQMGTMEGDISYDTRADYSAEHDLITVSNFEDYSTFVMAGGVVTEPVGAWGNGSVAYSVSGNTLTISVDTPEVGPVSQTYTRVS